MASGTAYRCMQPDNAVLNFDPDPYQRRPPVVQYRAPPKRTSRRHARSALSICRLPVEILHEILLDLDLISIGTLREVDTIMRRVADSLPPYSLLRSLASDTIHVMEAVECVSYFPVRRLFAEFCHPYCRTCRDFGPFLYLPTLTRSCYKCNLLRPEYELAPLAEVFFRFGLEAQVLESLSAIRKINPPRYWLVDLAQAKALGRRIHGNSRATKQVHKARVKLREIDYERPIWQFERTQSRDIQCKRPWRRLINNSPSTAVAVGSWRLEATAAFPYWDRKTQTLEPGAYCRACTYQWEQGNINDWRRLGPVGGSYPLSKEAAYRAFLEADLPEHFLHCPAVKANYSFRTGRMGSYGWDGPDFIVHPKNGNSI
ncbi:hypothetical protein BO70DRAFT_413863 [Aspergillus heteromorphus CBS 117.55]|uniref:F-box domain-containing protein n=1 Tax=Aspergillus heteromorphus CBS 117.55 TaxID=1448321 RepID=A0A317VDB7_9EURO|nr:uncharacterized protein BO70DRAFT_413863 [Aspergillus heteromorphus CBS 117.55]PWY72266.1 hypothetical protein BO70DRAFT_413863 [Aspergillus heteromorphus CBS 117.55]